SAGISMLIVWLLVHVFRWKSERVTGLLIDRPVGGLIIVALFIAFSAWQWWLLTRPQVGHLFSSKPAFYEPAAVKPPLTGYPPEQPRDGPRTLRLRSWPGSPHTGANRDRTDPASQARRLPLPSAHTPLGLEPISTMARRVAGSHGVRRPRGLATTFSPCPGSIRPWCTCYGVR